AVSPLRVEFSPWRFHRLMAIVSSLSDAGGSGAAATASAAVVTPPLWVTDAEYVAPVQLLSREGVGGRVAKWQPRSLSVWRGRVFLSAEQGQAEALESRSYWRGWRLMELSPDQVGGVDNAVALVPEGVRRELVSECPEALVLRLGDAREVAALRRGLNRSAALVESVAGLLEEDEDETADSATTSTSAMKTGSGSGDGGTNSFETKGGIGSTGGLGVTKDLLDELLAHRDLFELTGSLASLELRLNGRPPRAWRAIRRLALAEPPPLPGAGDLSGAAAAVRGEEVTGSMYQKSESHAGTDVEAPSHRHGGSVSSFSDFGGPLTSIASSGLKPTGQPSSVSAGLVARGAAGEGDTTAAVPSPVAAAAAAAAVVPGPSSQHGGSRVPGGSDTSSEVEFADAADYDDYDGGGGSASGGDEYSADEQQERLRELTLEQEVPLLAVALTSAAVRVQYSADRLAVGLRMHALRIDNELMGSALGSQFAVLAVSSSTSAAAAAAAAAGVKVAEVPGVAAAAAAPGESNVGGSGGVGDVGDGKEDGAPLVRLEFSSYSSTSSKYKGLDTEITLQLAALTLTCHRPTVAALMGLGTDMAYAINLLEAEKNAAAPPQPLQPQPPPAAAAAVAEPPVAAAVVRSGGEGRTLLRLRISMARLQLLMPYEV
ncbi:hypothetical protein VaNZ11_000965, partial [Volvox africanus]